MKFSELKVGTQFRVCGSQIPKIKLSDTTYQDLSKFYAREGVADEECVLTSEIASPDVAAFKDLVIGARFRFPSSTKHHVKISENEYRRMDSSVVIGNIENKCIPVFEPKELIFGDLSVGDKFTFNTKGPICTKVSLDKYHSEHQAALGHVVKRSKT